MTLISHNNFAVRFSQFTYGSPAVSSAMKLTICFLAALILPSTLAWAQTKQTSVEKALDISSSTGRPIFVMAGQET